MKLIFEIGRPGRRALKLGDPDVPVPDPAQTIPQHLLRTNPARLPEVTEPEIVRHYTALAHRNMSVDANFYPLGSCTMKYNPRVNERCAALPGLQRLHPEQPEETVQGMLRLLRELERALAEIGGMAGCSLLPAAGSQGELAGLLVIRAWQLDRGERARDEVLIPDSSHGTNPATCRLVGMRPRPVATNRRGCVDLDDLKRQISERTAAMMITNPNTLGIFEENIEEIARLVHEAGGRMYMDGANMNALLGIARPGDFGMDAMHFNLHKTFSVPHGGGGPGAGAIAVTRDLVEFLPVPRIVERDGGLAWSEDFPKSIGRLGSAYGNVGNLVRAYIYIRSLGREGLRRVAEDAVLHANYLLARLKHAFHVPYPRFCMHEFVISAAPLARRTGVRTLDIAKRLIDFGFHPPTIYFPLIVPEALMIEPTETETRETLDAFADALLRIVEEAEKDPDRVRGAPWTTPVRRLDERQAALRPKVRWTPPE